MRWTLTLELARDDGATDAYELGSITRSTYDLRPEEVGLTLEEGRQLVQGIECRMIADQIHAYTLCCRRCPECGRLQHFKDVRTKCVKTIHGSYRFRGRRISACPCQVKQGYSPAFFPLGDSGACVPDEWRSGVIPLRWARPSMRDNAKRPTRTWSAKCQRRDAYQSGLTTRTFVTIGATPAVNFR
jgi:hypothetical protein